MSALPSVLACRHLSQEARTVLTSLRSGPPHVARGDLAQDLMDLRSSIERTIGGAFAAGVAINGTASTEATAEPATEFTEKEHSSTDGILPHSDESTKTKHESVVPPSIDPVLIEQQQQRGVITVTNPYARPFLQVIMDPRAAGPHTLVALRSVSRMVQAGTLLTAFGVSAVELCMGILACKFEQTDAAIDEAVEMAIADVLHLIVCLTETTIDHHNRLPPAMFMDAFNTVFVTRHTFVHSPALAYHFEDVLTQMVVTAFAQSTVDNVTQVLLFSFLVNPLLHTPLVGGGGEYSTTLDESVREARMSHDDTRMLCLRLIRRALQSADLTADLDLPPTDVTEDNVDAKPLADDSNRRIVPNGGDVDLETECAPVEPSSKLQRTLLQIIQDDLCLSLLMTGQAIWAYNSQHSDRGSAASPGFVSLEVLSEICAVLAVLWNTSTLRNNLISQFETIWTGFYSRALVLLRKRSQPTNSASFHSNILFDAEVEIILESLVDLLCLHNHASPVADGSLETMFSFYDCHMRRSDVAASLFVELSRCCGGTVNEEGQAVVPSGTASRRGSSDGGSDGFGLEGEENASMTASSSHPDMKNAVKVRIPSRPVPAHLKELCAQALTGGMKCLFRDDHASAETVLERAKRRHSIMLRQVHPEESTEEDRPDNHHLRDLKSRKRLMCKAARIFNEKASRGIEFLVDSGLVADPVTPASMAAFLRNGIVVGLDKRAVGAYLGEAGKSPMAGKSPPCWERDWFHKDVLNCYCALFRFENQSLLDSLRMFLATFRLPGEAQQIDRILQAFSDRCSQVCEESKQGIFSSDPKRASDAAYLLSFSIIMLNTDRHNKNIREDRKMSCDDFHKNNHDYGRDITEKGKEFPREYLATIYDSINEEEIRTEGEGADGAMTVERWKDVLRGSTDDDEEVAPSRVDSEDLTELVLEHVWKPIVSAIGALWDVSVSTSQYLETGPQHLEIAQGNYLGVQGARLGMDMATEMLNGVNHLGRVDIFRKLFLCICDYTGLVGEYTEDVVGRTFTFSNSLESQVAVIVAIRTAVEYGERLDEECWRRIWTIMFELRDLKLLGYGQIQGGKGLLRESDPDFLNEIARIDWTMCLEKGDMDYNSRAAKERPKEKGTGLFTAFGRALFGQGGTSREGMVEKVEDGTVDFSAHGKEKLVVWDERAMSDDEDVTGEASGGKMLFIAGQNGTGPTLGMQFESLLVCENMDMKRRMDIPVTGLERMDETRHLRVSPRARVRERLRQSCEFESLVSESRFMRDESVKSLLRSLVGLVSLVSTPYAFSPDLGQVKFERSASDMSISSASITAGQFHVPISLASEAFAEVLICELALKNKDRMKALWADVLQDHYLSRLTSILVNPVEGLTAAKIPVDPGLEKRVTGLLRLSICAVQRADMANDVLSSWKYLLPMNDEQHASSPLRALDRHIGEGLRRIAADVDCLCSNLNEDGWEGLVSLMTWCAKRGGSLKPISKHGASGLAEDDPALQCYRTLHLLLNTKDLNDKVPCSVVWSLRCLIVAGGVRNHAQLSIASLDLLEVLHEKKVVVARNLSESTGDPINAACFWPTCWRKIIEGFAEAAEVSADASIRHHALSILTDVFLHKQGSTIPPEQLCSALSEVCVPLAGRRMLLLQFCDPSVDTPDQLMMEFELCIGLIFKPLRHHLKSIVDSGGGGSIPSIWLSVLAVLEDLLNDKLRENLPSNQDTREVIPSTLKITMNSLTNEHLQNAIVMMMSFGVLSVDDSLLSPGDLTTKTWEALKRMGFNDGDVSQWRQQANAGHKASNDLAMAGAGDV